MTEAGWVNQRNAEEVIRELPNNPFIDRKLLLWAISCVRAIPRNELRPPQPVGNEEIVIIPQTKEQLEKDAAIVERFADGMADIQEVRESWGTTIMGVAIPSLPEQPRHWANRLATDEQFTELKDRLLRDIFGNPFRPVAFSSEWCTDTAIALARQMYDSREFGAMPILADALQDAGCDNDDILSHCRDAKQVHVCGCWVRRSRIG